MTTKNLLLGTSALAASIALALPATAQSVGARDTMTVSLSGNLRFNMDVTDQDVTDGRGRGYSFRNDEAEIRIDAKNTADNGIEYGVTFEVNANSDDTAATDETWMFIDSAHWGRIEMGDQDDATDRMYVEGDDVLVGRAGPDGDVGDTFAFGTGGAVSATGNTQTGDATKVIYFSPRFSGFQVGASWTPDSGASGAAASTDNDGDFENVLGLAANWEGKFDDVSVVLSLTGEFGDSETAAGAEDGDLETISVGGTVSFGAFAFGAGYVDFAEAGITQANQALGEDAGEYYVLGGSYKSGPWGVSLAWFDSSKSQPTGSGGDTEVQIISLDIAYAVAPGWDLMLSANAVEADNINATATEVNNSGSVIIISNEFTF
jgi:outer membrane protein OmpU